MSSYPSGVIGQPSEAKSWTGSTPGPPKHVHSGHEGLSRIRDSLHAFGDMPDSIETRFSTLRHEHLPGPGGDRVEDRRPANDKADSIASYQAQKLATNWPIALAKIAAIDSFDEPLDGALKL